MIWLIGVWVGGVGGGGVVVLLTPWDITVKILKVKTPKKFAVITLKFEEGCFTIE